MSDPSPVIVWFRQDCRIRDNPALAEAIASGSPVLPVYVHAPDEEDDWAPGGASRWWLHHALESLKDAFDEYDVPLLVLKGPTRETLRAVARSSGAGAVYWNRRYEPAAVRRDTDIKSSLRQDGLDARSFNASLLWEPHEVETGNGDPYRVFTPFWKQCRQLPVQAPAVPDLASLRAPREVPDSLDPDGLGLLPDVDWASEFSDQWSPTLESAHEALATFARSGVEGYSNRRDRPSVDGTSRLSPFLHFGQLGPRQIWQAVHESGAAETGDGVKFLSELAWREFAHHLLFHYPDTPTKPLNDAYADFPWSPDGALLEAWQNGVTGYPIVDAGMRQLWRTGWMHNRVRMVAASLLVKHLLQPWQDGARWFWDTLVDADLANNTMGWQWTAGCGADAAPYFRIFNPTLQGQKFDPDGDYVRRWVPELADLPAAHIHEPWNAPRNILRDAGVRLGNEYPEPVVAHKAGRQRALDALAENKRRRQRDT